MQNAAAVLRIFFGVVYFTNGLSKFVPGIAHLPGGYYLIDGQGAKSIIQHNAAHHPVAIYHDLVFNLFVPNWDVFGPLVGLAEMTAGVLLLLGLASGLGALLAA
ncbi:MAG: DoxX family membrane protein, partial [Chloroflexi bacterium]